MFHTAAAAACPQKAKPATGMWNLVQNCTGDWLPLVPLPLCVDEWVPFVVYPIAGVLVVLTILAVGARAYNSITRWGSSFIPQHSCLFGFFTSVFQDNELLQEGFAYRGCCASLWFGYLLIIYSVLAVVHILLIVLYWLWLIMCRACQRSQTPPQEGISTRLRDAEHNAPSHNEVRTVVITQELVANATNVASRDRPHAQGTQVAPTLIEKLRAAEKTAADDGDYERAARLRDSCNEYLKLGNRVNELKKMEAAAKSAQKYEEAEAFKTELLALEVPAIAANAAAKLALSECNAL